MRRWRWPPVPVTVPVTLVVVVLILVFQPVPPTPPVPTVPASASVPPPTSMPATTTSSTTTSSTTTTTIPVTVPVTFPPVSIPERADIACATIRQLPTDRYLERITDFCLPVAWALTDLIDLHNDRIIIPDLTFEEYWQAVLHMLYVVSFESGGDPLANSVNWGCPRNERLRPDDDTVCAYYGSRVPLGWISHMSHLVEERSYRLLGYLIDPYSLYEASLLGFALVYEIEGNGWYHWWHIAWTANEYTSRYGITPTRYCPPDAYWGDVRGGYQECPYD